uniref:NADH dehydrogenase subunit 6 n=1 Tax=Dematophora necatrix TaxID=2751867 RepID=UPI0030DE2B37
MSCLAILNETGTNGFMIDIIGFLSLLGISCGILVIVSKNPIVSILFLIGLFSFISCYLISLGLTFIGLSYLIVYIGAVSILFLFILMLINIRVSELQSITSNSIFLAMSIGIIFNSPVFDSSLHNITNLYSLDLKNKILLVTSIIWDGYMAENNHITSIGNIMYTNYNIWLILASFILLLAMVGAIVITIKPKN